MTIAGPLWTGPINSPLFINKMIDENDFDDEKLSKFLKTLEKESHITQPFYDLHQICKKNHLEIPRREKLFEELKSQGYKAEKTHHEPTGFKSDINYKELLKIIKDI